MIKVKCDTCGKVCKGNVGLSAHKRFADCRPQDPKRTVEGSVRVEKMLDAPEFARMSVSSDGNVSVYSGKLVVRLGSPLHEHLAQLARAQNTSLNDVIVTLLKRGSGFK